MDLFIMRRYGGEDGTDPSSRKKDNLSQLLSKIESRKKARESAAQELTTFDEAGNRVNSFLVLSNNKDHLNSNKRISSSVNVLIDNDVTDPTTPKVLKDKSETFNQVDHLSSDKKRKSHSVNIIDDDGVKVPTPSKVLNDTDEMFGDDSAPKRKKLDHASNLFLKSLGTDKNVICDTDISGKDQNVGFTILGSRKSKIKKKVKRVLPHWLAKPCIVSKGLKGLTETINDIPELDKDLIKHLEENNITHFFPVQCEVIPWLLKAHKRPVQYRPNDLCVSAPTGSGKTLAFVLPIIQALKPRVMRHIRALVVLPVQELAVQVHQVFKEYCKGTDLKVLLLTGQSSFFTEQRELVKTNVIIGQYNAVDIVVTTPGRLVDHLNGTPGFSLKYLRFLVIDEADRVIDRLQNNWLHYVEKHIHGEQLGNQMFLTSASLHSSSVPPPQKLLFSATLTDDPELLERLQLFQPKLFTTVCGEDSDSEQFDVETHGNFVGKFTTPVELTEKYCLVDPAFKPLVLYHLITKERWNKVLCFTQSRESTHRLALLLRYLFKGALKVGELSASLKHSQRDRILLNFSSGKLNVLVCSDALARGIDVPGVDYVVLYDPPKFIKTYIHRIGRTGRAGRTGTAITFLTNEEVKGFRSMLRTASKEESVKEMVVNETEMKEKVDDYKEAIDALQNKIQEAKSKNIEKSNYLKNFMSSRGPIFKGRFNRKH